jgi:signal-transduction protein with cAMP-binding, CBS, and nucleotidyltransferase domain
MHKADLETIETLAFFNELSPEELAEIVPLMSVMPVLEGERLVRAGDAAAYFYINLSGSYMLHDAGGKALTIHDRGNVLGESVVLGDRVHPISVTALTDGSVLLIPWDVLQPVMEQYPELEQKIAAEVEMVRETRTGVLDTSMFPPADPAPAA